jgi:hypothetical protein
VVLAPDFSRNPLDVTFGAVIIALPESCSISSLAALLCVWHCLAGLQQYHRQRTIAVRSFLHTQNRTISMNDRRWNMKFDGQFGDELLNNNFAEASLIYRISDNMNEMSKRKRSSTA